jgi:hypothetical protein
MINFVQVFFFTVIKSQPSEDFTENWRTKRDLVATWLKAGNEKANAEKKHRLHDEKSTVKKSGIILFCS